MRRKALALVLALLMCVGALASCGKSENGGYAFSGCSGLTSVTIGNGVTSIDHGAFDGFGSLTEVYYEGTESDWDEIEISSRNDELTNATRYYYPESEPTEEGNFWHYVDGVVTKW